MNRTPVALQQFYAGNIDSMKKIKESQPEFFQFWRNQQGQSFMTLAAQSNNLELIQSLLSVEPNMNIDHQDEEKKTPLMYAIEAYYQQGCSDISVLEFLLQSGVKTELKDIEGLTCADYIHKEGSDLSLMQTFIKHNVDMETAPQIRPLIHILATDVALDQMEILLESGYNPNVIDGHGNTAIMDLCLIQTIGAIFSLNQLINYYADLDFQNPNTGRTALHYACVGSNRSLDIVNVLLSNGAKTEIRDITGKTALDLAEETGNDLIVFMINNKKKNLLKRFKPEITKYDELYEDVKFSSFLMRELARTYRETHEENAKKNQD